MARVNPLEKKAQKAAGRASVAVRMFQTAQDELLTAADELEATASLHAEQGKYHAERGAVAGKAARQHRDAAMALAALIPGAE